MAELTAGLHQLADVVADRYRIHALLGQRETTATYQAEDLQSHCWVVLKLLCLEDSGSKDLLQDLEREADALEQIEHPGIPSYITHFHIQTATGDRFYWVQEFAAGQSLEQLRTKGWQTSQADIQKLAAEVLERLIYLRQLDPPIIHQNINPKNIIRQPDGQIFLVDFGGIQSAYGNALQQQDRSAWTMSYMAPEQLQGISMFASDLYGLGATLIYLLIDRNPDELSKQQLRVALLGQAKISKAFEAWLEKLIASELQERWGDAAIALKRLETFTEKRKHTKHTKKRKVKQEPAPEEFSKIIVLSRERKAHILRKSSFFKLYIRPAFSTQLFSFLSVVVPTTILGIVWIAILTNISASTFSFISTDSMDALELIIFILAFLTISCGSFLGSFYIVIKTAIDWSNEIQWAKTGWNFFKIKNGYCVASLRLCGLNRKTKFFNLRNVKGIEIQECLVTIESEGPELLNDIFNILDDNRQYAKRLNLKIRGEEEVQFGGDLTLSEMEQLQNYVNYFLRSLKSQEPSPKGWLELIQRWFPIF